MKTAYENKTTVAEIRARFDHDVERFSNLETGQAAQIDAPLHLDLLTKAACAVTPRPAGVLDLGCGAGNYTLKLLQQLGGHAPDRVTLLDLSRPMLDRAAERVGAVFGGEVVTVQADVREFDFDQARFDLVMAAQCLHHLRCDDEWEHVFCSIFRSLRPGGSFWVADSLDHEHPPVQRLMWDRWGAYLEGLEGRAYRDHVLAYVQKEDSPRPLLWQLDLMRRVGFVGTDVLHVHSRFGSFGGVRSPL